MSYICMIANKNGAVVASDSRAVKNIPVSGSGRVASDRVQKTFYSSGGKVVWAMCGVRSLHGTDYLKSCEKILKADSVPFGKRLVQFQECMKTATALYQKTEKKDGISTLLFASYYVKKNPVIGMITIKNGVILNDVRYRDGCFVESGSNIEKLLQSGRYAPDAATPVEELEKRAIHRVKEAIEKDTLLAKYVPGYQPCVGGRVQMKSLRVCQSEAGAKKRAS